VPDRLTVRGGFPADPFSYSRTERQAAVKLALSLARNAASAVLTARTDDDAGELADHAADLLIYARSVANGVVPGALWQTVTLGYLVSPCDGRRNRCLQPRPDASETLAEVSAAGAA
jgi:hypothetical protein